MLKKSVLRQQFLKKRKKISDGEKKNFSAKICTTLQKILQQQNFSGYVALFAGLEDEVNILSLVGAPIYRAQNTKNSSLLSNKEKNFCFPRVTDAKNGQMEFFAVEKISDLEKGNFGILEPKKYCTKIPPEKIIMVCVPAVSIDTQGNRIGMGGGFYDRYLENFSQNIHTIGVIFECQKSQKIFETEKFDIPVDMVVTEKQG